MVEENEINDEENQNEEGKPSEENAEETTSSSELNRKKIIMILLPLLLVIGATVGVYFSGVADNILGDMAEKTEEQPVDGDVFSQKEIVDTVFYDLPEMVINLQSHSRKQGSLMRIKVSLELEKATDIPKIEEVLPRITDTFIVHLREVRPEELEGSAGVYRLKEELLYRVNRAIRPAKVYDIRFKQFEIH